MTADVKKRPKSKKIYMTLFCVFIQMVGAKGGLVYLGVFIGFWVLLYFTFIFVKKCKMMKLMRGRYVAH